MPGMLPTLRCLKSGAKSRSGSSARYLQRQKADPFVKARKVAPGNQATQGNGSDYRSRSAFKLVQLNDKYRFLDPSTAVNQPRAAKVQNESVKKDSPFQKWRPHVVVDLGAAPGGWTQVAVNELQKAERKQTRSDEQSSSLVFALDILPMDEIPGAEFLQGNFLESKVQDSLRQKVSSAAGSGHDDAPVVSFADVILSDMMANTTGNPIRDTTLSLELVETAYSFACATLRRRQIDFEGNELPGGWFVAKIFTSPEADQWRSEILNKAFRKVSTEKVEASRKESREVYWVAKDFKGPIDS